MQTPPWCEEVDGRGIRLLEVHVEKDGLVNNYDDVGEDNIVTPQHTFEPILLFLFMNGIGLQDNSLHIVHVHVLEVEPTPRSIGKVKWDTCWVELRILHNR